jgi:hypothetical protein
LTIPLEYLLYPLACFIVYLPCLNGPPIFDDNQVIPEARSFRWSRLKDRPYRLLTLLTFAGQFQWPGTIRSLHVGNMLIHSINGVILLHIAQSMGWDYGLALLTGLLFVVHPFAVNSVGYLTGRASILSATFGLGAVLVVLLGHGLLALPLLFLAFCSKEDGVGFVPLILSILIYKEWF